MRGGKRTQRAFAGPRPCVGCFEPIPGDAILCPYCVTAQSTSRWATVGTGLKWAGATITVLSLVMGVLALRGLYADWRERNDTVAQLIAAAELLEHNGGYARAWSMYGEALALAPGSPVARRGQVDAAMRRLRHVTVRGEETFTDVVEPIVPVLYRGLASSSESRSGRRTGDLLAHIGWAYYLMARDRDNAGYRDAFERGRVDDLFERATRADPENAHAHAMWGFWLTLSDAPLDEAREHFERAMASARRRDRDDGGGGVGDGRTADDGSYAGVRRRQINAVRFILARPSGVTGERRQAAADELLRIANSMRIAGDPPPDEDARYYLFNNYGRMGRAENVEHVLALLPPSEHLATFVWLFEDMYVDDPDRPFDRHRVDQRRYVTARLMEESGDEQPALVLYQELAALDAVHEELNVLVDAGITRLSGAAPARAIARAGRGFIDDEMSAGADPWAFHEETLLAFDPGIDASNTRQAVEYFATLPEEAVAVRTEELVALFENSRGRVRRILDEKEAIVRQYGYTTSYSIGHAETAQHWHRVLWRLLGHFCVEANQLDRAVAELGDLLDRSGPDTVHGAVHYDLARAHTRRAEQRAQEEGVDDSCDVEAALDHLQKAVDIALRLGGPFSWDAVKTDPDLEPLRDDPRYLALVRGR